MLMTSHWDPQLVGSNVPANQIRVIRPHWRYRCPFALFKQKLKFSRCKQKIYTDRAIPSPYIYIPYRR